MFRYINYPPKTGEDVEFGESGLKSIRDIPTTNDYKELRHIEGLGAVCAKELIDNMDNPSLAGLLGIVEEASKKELFFSSSNVRTSAFLKAAVEEASKYIYKPVN